MTRPSLPNEIEASLNAVLRGYRPHPGVVVDRIPDPPRLGRGVRPHRGTRYGVHLVRDVVTAEHDGSSYRAARWLCGGSTTAPLLFDRATRSLGLLCPRCAARKRGVVVYRCWAPARRLLYVGCTADLDARLRQHARIKSWWAAVVAVDHEGYPSVAAARTAEGAAIAQERPLHNVRGVA